QYSNMNTVHGQEMIAVLPSKTTPVHLTGVQTEYIGDPLNFTGIRTFIRNNQSKVYFDVFASFDFATSITTINNQQIIFKNIPLNAFFNIAVKEFSSPFTAAVANIIYQSSADI